MYGFPGYHTIYCGKYLLMALYGLECLPLLFYFGNMLNDVTGLHFLYDIYVFAKQSSMSLHQKLASSLQFQSLLSHSNTAFSSFRTIWTENACDKYIHMQTSLYLSFNYILISIVRFMGISDADVLPHCIPFCPPPSVSQNADYLTCYIKSTLITPNNFL